MTWRFFRWVSPAATALLLIVTVRPAGAQRLSGAGDDAIVLRRGELRWSLGGDWRVHDELLDGTGKRHPLGDRLTIPNVGASAFQGLAPAQSSLQSILGDPSATVSIGSTRLREELQSTALPIALEYGITRRLTVGVMVPIVWTYASAVLDINRTAPTSANLALNPGLTAPVAATAAANVRTQALAAVAQLQSSYPACFGASPGPGCAPTIALANATTALGNGVATVYGATGKFAPITGSPLQTQVLARFASINAQLRAALGTPPAASDPIAARPVAAPVAMGLADLNKVLFDPTFGLRTDTLTSLERTARGDIEVSAKYLWLDGLGDASLRSDSATRFNPHGVNLRSSAGLIVRLGTAARPYLGQFLDPGAGDGSTAIELRSTTDIVIGPNFWASVSATYASVLGDRIKRRVPASLAEIFPLAIRTFEVDRKMGDWATLEIAPRWAFSDYFGLSGHYLYFVRRGDRYSGSVTVNDIVTGLPVTLDPSAMNTPHQVAHRLGLGFTYSTLAAHRKGKTGLAFDVTYQRVQVVSGENTPFLTQDRIALRFYTPILGGP